MSSTSVPRDESDFRAAAGLRTWPVVTPDGPGDGPGLFAVDDGARQVITNVRRLVGSARTPGSVLIACAAWLLALLAAGLFFVSFAGQYTYLFAARHHQGAASMIEAAMLDAGMIVFSLLALGLARAGKPARTERALILACSLGSAGMNFGAADTASPRSVAAYVAAPVFLAVVVDRVIAVIRRHVLGDAEASAWTALGAAAVTSARAAGLILLYSLRMVLAPRSTATGVRQVILAAAPLPEPPARLELTVGDDDEAGDQEDEDLTEPPELAGASKRARLAWWYERDPGYGQRGAVGPAAKRISARIGLSEGTARAYLGQILNGLEREDRAS